MKTSSEMTRAFQPFERPPKQCVDEGIFTCDDEFGIWLYSLGLTCVMVLTPDDNVELMEAAAGL